MRAIDLMLIFVFSSLAVSAQSSGKPDEAALASAETFLQLLDEGQWQAAYDSGQFIVDFATWEDLVVLHRKDRGAHSGREFFEARPRLGAPGDETVKKTELVFDTTFEDGAWTESVGLVTRGGGPWVVEGYTIGRKLTE